MKYNDNGLWKDINIKVADTLPVGTIIPFGGTLIPANYRECDGSTLSRTEYALLFAAIGTSFGEGDGSTTFNLPDLRGKVPVGLDLEDTDFDTIGETGGEKEHTLTIAEMPRHSHDMPKVSGSDVYRYVASSGDRCTVDNVWTTLATGGNQPHNIMQPYQIVKYIIKVLDAPASGIRSETLPVGTEVDFDGATTDIPTGWQPITPTQQILWTNSNPTSNFTEQTITLSSEDYDFYEVYFTYNGSNASQYANGFKTIKGKGLIISENGYGTGLSVRRKVDYTDATHLLISSAYGGTNTDNGYLIPIYVIGYKTGLFD